MDAPKSQPELEADWENRLARDWFAAAAITGLLSRVPGSPQDDQLVDLAFMVADKMMNRRKK